MRRAIIVYLAVAGFFMIFFGIFDGWEGVRAYLRALLVVAVLTLVGVGVAKLAKKLGIRIND